MESGTDRKGPGKIEHTDIVPTALHKDLTSGSFGVFSKAVAKEDGSKIFLAAPKMVSFFTAGS